ncbi:MAG: hypothetical protein ACK47B_23920 [Armatimonadota bacterium]
MSRPRPSLTPEILSRLADVIWDDELQLEPEDRAPGVTRVIVTVPAQAAMNRLDAVVGPAGWSYDWTPMPEGVLGRLTVLGVQKTHLGATTAEALVACARRFGIGAYLEYLPELRAEWLGDRWAHGRPRWEQKALFAALEKAGAPN